MKKYFNVNGLIIPDEHYYAPIDKNIKQIFEMIERKEYFVINKPRQYGKTTTVSFLKKFLNKSTDYLCISISFEGFGKETWSSEKNFCEDLLEKLCRDFLLIKYDKIYELIEQEKEKIIRISKLDFLFTKIVTLTSKKIVLLIDEVDTGKEQDLLINFLSILRQKYLSAKEKEDHTFHSVILSGVHDVKTLKGKISGGESKGEKGSPWNIAADFNVQMELKPDQIEKMLIDYMKATKVQLDAKLLAEKIFYWTSGYPYLVSALCKIMDEELLPEKSIKKLDISDLNDAIQVLLFKQTTNFESLIKNIKNNSDIYDLVVNIIFKGEDIPFNMDVTKIQDAVLYGILKNYLPVSTKKSKYCKIHNRIYEQRIYNYISDSYRNNNGRTIASDIITAKYLDKNNDLILDKLLIDFQTIIKSKYASDDALKSDEFLEKQVRLLFFVFLEPLLNNKGFSFKEVETSLEKRMDILIIYNNKKYIVELKLFYGQEYHKQGLEQLNVYLDRENITKGYIMLFDKKKTKQFKSGWLKYKDKDIFELWF